MARRRRRAGFCRNCGKAIAEWPYGAGLRWYHIVRISSVWVPGDPWCQTTSAEPDRRRRVRNRYAPWGL